MTLAVLLRDNADPKTGLEHGTQVGDGGFILKPSDGAGTSRKWKAHAFSTGPINGDTRNPRVRNIPIPPNWFAPDHPLTGQQRLPGTSRILSSLLTTSYGKIRPRPPRS
jgi:hypothetical protein